jgi:hypothetical protein
MYQMFEKEPFNIPKSRVAFMTDWEIINVYCRPDKAKKATAQRFKEAKNNKNFWPAFQEIWRKKGCTDAEIELQWRHEGHGDKGA